MALAIDIIDETNVLTKEQVELVKSLLQFVAVEEKVVHEAELSVSFVTNAEIARLNLEYRGIDAATDVLSFAMEEGEEADTELAGLNIPTMLGDIIIATDKITEQAAEYGHSFERELGFLVVHGFLHILGYDHQTEADEKEMFMRQTKLLGAYGLER